MPKTSKTKSSTSTALAHSDQWNDPFKDFGEPASQLQLKIPVVKIEYLANKQIQTEHPEWQRGKFSLSIGEQLDFLLVGLLGLRYGRVCWLKEFDPNHPDVDPDCKSDDGIFPSAAIEHPLTDVSCSINGQNLPVCVHCTEQGEPIRRRSGKYVPACPNAHWRDRKTPPVCHDFFTLLLWEHQLNLPLIFSVKGTGIKHLNQLHMDMIRAVREVPSESAYHPSCYVRIRIRAVPNSNWFEPHFHIDGFFQETDASINAEAKKELLGDFSSMPCEHFAFDKAQEENRHGQSSR